MIQFPNAKINLGLNVTGKRTDGFHNIETLFYPIPFCDILEIVHTSPPNTNNYKLFASGLSVNGNENDNLCVKAYLLLKKDFSQLPAIDIHLYKNIPMGAGLGGGSADGAFMLLLLNKKFNLDISKNTLVNYALQLGSDCPFFIINKPCFAKGRGEETETAECVLSGHTLVIVNPGIHVNTGIAFSKISPAAPAISIKEIIKRDSGEWKNLLVNDFEKSVFAAYPAINEIKEKLYLSGAVYASMTGTGSTVYGLFTKKNVVAANIFPSTYFVKEMELL
jgi:4-diphosphocytidyl-2-C-methyl-D-erythritol kinase